MMDGRASLRSVPEDQRLSFSGGNKKIRHDVEALVRRVLPDEIDGVDQMLEEFRGREDELLESLYRMEQLRNSASSGPECHDQLALDGGESGGFDVDQWQEDLDKQLDGDSNNYGQPDNSVDLKSPPDPVLLAKANGILPDEEEKYYSTPPTSGTVQGAPIEVETNSMSDLMLSNVSLESDQSSGSDGNLARASSETSVAVVKLRVWDPANPKKRLEFLTSTNIILPNDETDKGATQSKDRNHGIKSRRLSSVEEEPESPPHRGDSFHTKDDDRKVFLIKDDGGNINDGGRSMEGGLPKNTAMGRPLDGLHVGSVVGIQPKQPSTSPSTKYISSSASIASSYSIKRQFDWKLGKPINLSNIDILSLDELPELHYRIENGFSSLCELIMDGLPPLSLELDEAELIFEALGTNTSIKRLSMRYSGVNDDIGSLFALVLVDNDTLTQLLLEGNAMTNLAAKNFYSVLKKNNETLRLLDLNNNPMIDDDVEQALDQFMEQKALKRTLTNKAEKAKRAAKGLPPDPTLDEDEDEDGSGQVTVVCPQHVIDWALGSDGVISHNQSGYQHRRPQDIANDEHHTGEHFRDYMQRMENAKLDQSQAHLQNMMDDSIKERNAFDAFAAASADEPEHQSHGSSLTSHSTQKQNNQILPQHDVIVTASNNDQCPGSLELIQETSEHANESMGAERQLPTRMNTTETQESADVQPGATHVTPVYHDTRVSRASKISDEDYVDPKADEREIRRQLATEGGAVGAYHIQEAAFARQNRANRPARRGRTESERRARLAELEGHGNPATGNQPIEPVIDADIERADDAFDDMTSKRESRLSVIGLGGDMSGIDVITCGLLALLFLALLVMIIIFFATKS